MGRVEHIGRATLYLGDCSEILPSLGQFDACVTDPPYGIGADETASSAGKQNANRIEGLSNASKGWRDYGESSWDRDRPPAATFDAIRKCSKHQIIWGGNYFTDYLPPTMQWLVWDKGQRDFSLADFEMAWSSQNNAARIFDLARAVALQDGKFHPTQKPLLLMKWCIDILPKNVMTIVDPFMGSGTTGRAALDMGRTFVGIEREVTYFDKVCKRLEEAQKQGGLF